LGKILAKHSKNKGFGVRIANLIVGEKFRHSSEFIAYFHRVAKEKLSKIDSIIYLKDSDPAIIQELQNAIDKYDIVLVACSKHSCPLIAKSLATRLADTLMPKDDMLIPSKCTNYTKNSFLVNVSNKPVNVVRLEENEPIPEILATFTQKTEILNILIDNEEDAKLLINPIASTNDINVVYMRHQGGYVQLRAKESKYGNLPSFIHSVENLLPGKVALGTDLADFLLRELGKKGLKLAIAESCTGLYRRNGLV
jgi:nicotinamide-nucleotide amidase